MPLGAVFALKNHYMFIRNTSLAVIAGMAAYRMSSTMSNNARTSFIPKLGKSSSSAYYSISDPAACKNSRCRRHIKAFLKAQQAVKESSKRNMSF